MRSSSLVTDDFVNEHTSALGCVPSAAGTAAAAGFLVAFDGLHYEVEDVLADGDRAAVAYRLAGRLRRDRTASAGPSASAASSASASPTGLIAHRVDYWDGLDFQRQTGQG